MSGAAPRSKLQQNTNEGSFIVSLVAECRETLVVVVEMTYYDCVEQDEKLYSLICRRSISRRPVSGR